MRLPIVLLPSRSGDGNHWCLFQHPSCLDCKDNTGSSESNSVIFTKLGLLLFCSNVACPELCLWGPASASCSPNMGSCCMSFPSSHPVITARFSMRHSLGLQRVLSCLASFNRKYCECRFQAACSLDGRLSLVQFIPEGIPYFSVPVLV